MTYDLHSDEGREDLLHDLHLRTAELVPFIDEIGVLLGIDVQWGTDAGERAREVISDALCRCYFIGLRVANELVADHHRATGRLEPFEATYTPGFLGDR